MNSTAWTPASLPYTAEDLPCVLPTSDTIRASPAIIKQRTGEAIVAVTPQIVAKYGLATQVCEGQALLYLERCLPDVPAPRLYAMYQESGDTFILMERIPGVTLDAVWDQYSDSDKLALCKDLRLVLDKIRSSPPPDYFGAIGGGPLPHYLFFSPKGVSNVAGPFQDESGFNEALATQYRRVQELNNRSDFKDRFYTRNLQTALRGHQPTLTHSDIQKKNIIIIDHGPFTPARLQSSRFVLLDWESAGWYPDYWEYFSAFCAFKWDDDWCYKIEESITPWPAETALMKMLYTDLYF